MPCVTLCAIMRNEKTYILEWIAYHRLIGVDKIHIYSNDCSDGSDDLLASLADAKIIEHTLWPSTTTASPQVTAYKDALARCSTEWIGYLDADEFLLLHHDASLQDFLGRFDGFSAVAINWRLFGSNGEVRRREGLVTERFTRAGRRRIGVHQHCKSFARVRSIVSPHVHSVVLKDGTGYADTSCNPITIQRKGFTPTVRHDVAQINHYIVKSREEFEDKVRRGNANRPAGAVDKFRRGEDYWDKHDKNDEADEAMLQYSARVRHEIDALKAAIGF